MPRALLAPLALGALLVVACYGDSGTAVPTTGPARDVRLLTDDLGITHVFAQSDADALYGAGYAMARDRLLQMEVFRRQALGTSSELFGEKTFKADVGARAFDFRDLGAQAEARTRKERPDDAALVDAWVAGVNARIGEIRDGKAPRPYGMGAGADELNFLPEPWTAAHTFAIGKLLAFGLSNTLDQDVLGTAVLRLAPDFARRFPLSLPSHDVFTTGATPTSTGLPGGTPGVKDAIVPPVLGGLAAASAWNAGWPTGGHSNNWAVDAAHSANGRPLLAGDPHQPLTSPSRFWPVHLHAAGGGTLDVVGFAFVGTPVVELGHNAHVGWTATTNFADVMDLWDVTVDPDRTVVHLADGDHAITERNETIRVKTTDGFEDDPVTLDDVPGYGILLPDAILPLPRSFLVDGNAILFGWTGFRATPELSAFLAMDRAKSVDEFDAAADLVEVGAFNFVSADAQHIDYHVHVLVPDRGDPSAHPMPWRAMSGMDASSLWTGAMLPNEKLPRWRDPPRGYLATGNNDPWGFTADGNVENDPFYYGAYYSQGVRPFRIEQEIQRVLAAGKATVADMETLQGDTFSTYADAVVTHLATALATLDTDPALAAYRTRDDLRALASALVAWDRRMDADRGEPAAYTALVWFAAKRLFDGPLPGPLFDAIATKSPPYFLGALFDVLERRFQQAASFLPAGGEGALLFAALDDAATWLASRFHSTDPKAFRYADMNLATFTSANGGRSDPPPVGVSGGSDTVRVCEAGFLRAGATPGDTQSCSEASLYRMVVAFGDDGVPEATLDFARGAREDPDDPHFGDAEPAWVSATHAPLAFRAADVEARAKETVVLAGRGGP